MIFDYDDHQSLGTSKLFSVRVKIQSSLLIENVVTLTILGDQLAIL